MSGRKSTAVGVSLSAGETLVSISSPGKMDPITILPAASGFEDFLERAADFESVLAVLFLICWIDGGSFCRRLAACISVASAVRSVVKAWLRDSVAPSCNNLRRTLSLWTP